jgi:hypothetical protein
MALRVVRNQQQQQQQQQQQSPPPHRRRIKSCSHLPFLFGALMLVWFVYLLNVLSMAVGVHKLDPTITGISSRFETATMPKSMAQNQTTTTTTKTHTTASSATTTMHRDLSSVHHAVAGGDTAIHHQKTTTAAASAVVANNWREHLPAAAVALVEQQQQQQQQQQETGGQIWEELNAGKKEETTLKLRLPGFQAAPFGHMVEPEDFLGTSTTNSNIQQKEQQQSPIIGGSNRYEDRPAPPKEQQDQQPAPQQVLTAYLEPIEDRDTWWTIQPLPNRTSTNTNILTPRHYPKLNSCSRLPEQWPVDDYPDEDPFLPWIHDVFPTQDGKYLQFVAKNKRRCHTGTTPDEMEILEHMAPQVALFQHVPLRKTDNNNNSSSRSPRFRLASHEEADPESIATRFICRFQPSGEITFSEFNNDYEWVGYRKRLKKMFNENGRDNKQIHTSQLLFKCPIPPSLVDLVQTGASVVDDWATLFVDLIPVRTPPRYGPPEEFLVPHYTTNDPKIKEAKKKNSNIGSFDTLQAWGRDHVLPALDDSGRWANIPICKPSLLTYEPDEGRRLVVDQQQQEQSPYIHHPEDTTSSTAVDDNTKQHHLVSCLWTSTGYTTRGNRYAINDGQRRLVEWITFNKLLGFDHFYIYDNSGAFSASSNSSLQPVADLFPNDVTLIRWPSRVCNNNPNNVDSVGERSSQYAAESSCRLRFGPHVNWIGQFDIDEYLVPSKYYHATGCLLWALLLLLLLILTLDLSCTCTGTTFEIIVGEHSSILPLLEKLDQENTKILSFTSWRAWPRMTHINAPVPIRNSTLCGNNNGPCFELSIRKNTTFLEGYNCDRQKPGQKTKVMPAEKQIYRPDYVTQHMIHYSTVTQTTNLKLGDFAQKFKRRTFPDPLSRFADEVEEALMLHSKAVARQDTANWERNCHKNYTGRSFDQCRLGIPWPDGEDDTHHQSPHNEEGWLYDCYINKRIDNYWGPKLRAQLKEIGLLG